MLTERKSTVKNGFVRNFLPRLELRNALNTSYPLNNICGSYRSQYWFNDTLSSRLFYADRELKKLTLFPLQVSLEKTENVFYTMIDSGMAFIFSNNLPGIALVNLDSGTVAVRRLPKPYGRVAHIGQNSFVIRMLDSVISDQVFKKINLNIPKLVETHQEITRHVGDGGISTDGFLYYDRQSNLVCYTFFYQNGFICIDSNLSIKYFARTIDTISKEPVIGRRFVSGRNISYTIAAPPKLINYIGCTDQGLLYLNSRMRADNESAMEFQHSLVIDVYDLRQGIYKASLHIPDYEGEKASRFRVFNDELIAIQGTAIVKYLIARAP
jgi:hypothetical protein